MNPNFVCNRHRRAESPSANCLLSVKICVVNVVDLMTLQPASEHPHGLSDHDFNAIFTLSKPIIFAFHGYRWLITGSRTAQPTITACMSADETKSGLSQINLTD